MPATGGDAVQITRNGGDVPQESPDGKFLYYMKGDRIRSSAACGECRSEEVRRPRCSIPSIATAVWAVGGQGIYFFAKPDEKGHSEIRFYEFATGKTRKILTVERRSGLHRGFPRRPDDSLHADRSSRQRPDAGGELPMRLP